MRKTLFFRGKSRRGPSTCVWHSFILRYDTCLQEILTLRRNLSRGSFNDLKGELSAQQRSDRGPWEGIVNWEKCSREFTDPVFSHLSRKTVNGLVFALSFREYHLPWTTWLLLWRPVWSFKAAVHFLTDIFSKTNIIRKWTHSAGRGELARLFSLSQTETRNTY